MVLSEGSTGEKYRSKLTHMVVGKLPFLAVCWLCGQWLLAIWVSPAWHFVLSKPERKREDARKMKILVLYNLTMEESLLLFSVFYLLISRCSPCSRARNNTRMYRFQKAGIIGKLS